MTPENILVSRRRTVTVSGLFSFVSSFRFRSSWPPVIMEVRSIPEDRICTGYSERVSLSTEAI